MISLAPKGVAPLVEPVLMSPSVAVLYTSILSVAEASLEQPKEPTVVASEKSVTPEVVCMRWSLSGPNTYRTTLPREEWCCVLSFCIYVLYSDSPSLDRGLD